MHDCNWGSRVGHDILTISFMLLTMFLNKLNTHNGYFIRSSKSNEENAKNGMKRPPTPSLHPPSICPAVQKKNKHCTYN